MTRDEEQAKLKKKNYAMLAAILGFVAIVFVVSILKMQGN